MAYGIQVWDAAGNLILGPGHRVGRVIDVFYTGTDDGYRTPPANYNGSLWAAVLSSQTGIAGVYVSGGTIYWNFAQFRSTDGYRFYGAPVTNTLVVYGCY